MDMATQNSEVYSMENGVVYKVTTQKIPQCTTEEFTESFKQAKIVATPILPDGCKFYAHRGRKRVYIIEEPPQVRELFADPHKNHVDSELLKVNIKLPYAVYIIVFNNYAYENSYLFARGTPLQSAQDTLNYMPLPNLYEDGALCTGTGLTIQASDNNFIKKVTDCVAHLWESHFNNDLSYYWSQRPKKIIQIPLGHEWESIPEMVRETSSSDSHCVEWMHKWHEASKDPIFYLDENDLKKYDSVNSVINRFLEYREDEA